MTVRFTPRPAGFRRAAMLAMAVMLVPLPLFAADGAGAKAAQPLQTSVAEHAKRDAAMVAASKVSGARSQQTPTRAQKSNDPHSPGFFRSPAGVACLAVIAAGTGYALYSASHDRIHSVARQGQ